METQSEELGSVGQRLGLGPGVEPQLGVEGEVLRTVANTHQLPVRPNVYLECEDKSGFVRAANDSSVFTITEKAPTWLSSHFI